MTATRVNARANDRFGRANGIPPVAAGVVCVDFDDTIFGWGELMDRTKKPLPGAVEAIQALKAAGYRIVILTSRMSMAWLTYEFDDPAAAQLEQFAYVAELLTANGIPFDSITAEKVPSLAYFDDKGVRVSKAYPLAEAVDAFLLERATKAKKRNG